MKDISSPVPAGQAASGGPEQALAGPGQAPPGGRQPGTDQQPGADRQEAAELLRAISAVRRTARRAVRHAWRTEPLPTAQSELLRLVARQPGISVAEAAQELRLAPNTVSTLVGRLAAQDLLSRERALPDGRLIRLRVTPKAQQRMADWRDLRAELATSALEQLTAADRDALAAAVPALLRLAERLAMP